MENLSLIIVLISGALIGFLASKILDRSKDKIAKEQENLNIHLESLKTAKQLLEENLSSRNTEVEKLSRETHQNREQILELNIKLSGSEADYRNLQEKIKEQKSELETIREKFVFEFKSLANDILVKESKTFTDLNKSNMEALLKPLGEKIKDFEKKVEDSYDKESKQRFSLKEEVTRLAQLNQQISHDAQNLASALKGQSKTQGNWGEMILESILEKSGLEKGREFLVQKSFKSDSGGRLQPDVVLTLPDNKNIVIDAKVSLTAYEKYASTNQADEQEAALKSHLISIKKHIDELSAKNYQHIYELKSLDFVIMFLPIEPSFLLAIKSDPDLWNYAYTRNVLLIGPTNLYATLKMMASLWQHEYQNRNVAAIAEESGKLYDKFVGFVKDIREIGDRISATQTSYDNAFKKLSTGRGNLIAKAEKIKSLGARTNKEIPISLIDHSKNELNSLDIQNPEH